MADKVLVVDDKQMMRDSVSATLQRAGLSPVVAGDGQTALSLVAKHRPSAVVTDLKMPEMDGLELLDKLKQADDQLPVVLMTAYGTVDDAVKAMKQGAFDFVQKPFEGDQLVMVVQRAVEHRELLQENAALKTNASAYDQTPALIGKSRVMRNLAQQIEQIAGSHGTVLVTGESGSGKEVVARTLHARSPRQDRTMLCLNCAALSSSLLESELFGHEKGAFTGADQLRKGRFELADGGTLLLDEISEIGPQLQAKLLRVLQEGQFERVGASISMQVDVRVIATTNRDLTRSVENGDFRQDLYYRLNVLPIHLPPLRERAEDVPLLAEHFLQQVAQREGGEAKRFDDEALSLMQQYAWPGNVRELQNICERASVLCKDRVIPAATIRPWLGDAAEPAAGGGQPSSAPAAASSPAGASREAHTEPAGEITQSAQSSSRAALAELKPEAPINAADAAPAVEPLENVERQQILQALDYYNGNRHQAARALGIGVRTLGMKLKKWKEQNLVGESV
jgi:DNA-binding NtrC family response regulator